MVCRVHRRRPPLAHPVRAPGARPRHRARLRDGPLRHARRSWIAQRQALASARERFAVYEDVNAALQDEVSELRSTQGTRDAIRSQLGYLLPNEKRVPLLDSPAASVELPARWPYSIVAGILSVRGERARANGTIQPLGPLQP
ncbi:MAG: hypothetical protein RL283_1712 [Actinomycetota bacterium]